MDGVVFSFNPNANYSLVVHDPKYFIMSARQQIFPGIYRLYQSEVRDIIYYLDIRIHLKFQNIKPFKSDINYISVTEHHILNRPDRQCEVNIMQNILVQGVPKKNWL